MIQDLGTESHPLPAFPGKLLIAPFTKAINKITESRVFQPAPEQTETQPDHIFIRSNSRFFRLNFDEIVYIEGMKDYLKIHLRDYTLVTHQTMSEMEKQLPATRFIRVHRSYIISISKIKSVFGNRVELTNKTLPIGINYKDGVSGIGGNEVKHQQIFLQGKPITKKLNSWN